MVLAMLFSLVCLATIVAKLKGWNADVSSLYGTGVAPGFSRWGLGSPTEGLNIRIEGFF